MTYPPHISEMPKLTDAWPYVAQWLTFSSKELTRFSQKTRGQLFNRVREYAETMAAQDRISQLEPIAQRSYGVTTRVLLKAIVVMIGALTFGQGFSLLARHLVERSEFVPVTTLVGGLATSVGMDALATQALTNWNKRRDVHKHLQQLKQQQKRSQGSSNELTDWFYDSQYRLIERVEWSRRVWQIPVHTLAACTLSTIEFVITRYIVNHTVTRFMPAPLVVRVAIATLPVVITWVASLLQSEYFERPDYSRDLIRQYERHIIPDAELSEAEFYDWTHHRLYEDGRLDAGLAFVLGRGPTLKIKNLSMAYAHYDILYYSKRIRQLEQEYKTRVQQLQENFQAELMNLPDKALLPPLIIEDRSDLEIYEQEERRRRLRQAWIEAEKPKLIVQFKESIKATKADYIDEFKRQCQKLKDAVQDYRDHYIQWRNLNDWSL